MKRILVTESQYNKLVKLLNEQFFKFNNPEDEKDASHDILDALTHLTGYFAMNKITKDVYVDKIEHGVVYLDSTKYSSEEKEQIEKIIDQYVAFDINPRDKVLPNVFGFDSGIDSDFVSGDIAVVDNENSDVAEVEDNSDVAVIDDSEEEVFKTLEACNFGNNNKGNRRKVILPPSMDIKFYQDILKSIGTKVTCEKMLFFFAWRTGEHSESSYNPFATTYRDETKEGCYYNCLPENKSGLSISDCITPTGCRSCKSKCVGGVRNYKTYDSGLNATVKTLTNGRYNNVVRKLRNDNSTAYDIASEVNELRVWGTGGLVIEIIKWNGTINPNRIKRYEGSSIEDDDCSLTVDEQRFYKQHIKTTADGNAFRNWVNQDTYRLNYVNRMLSDCDKNTGLDKTGSLNDYVEIAFKHKGKEWVSEGKPELSTDDENVDLGSLTFLPPNKKGWNIRGTDCYGSGSYGASRGNRSHKGVDIKSDEGDIIVSPIDGFISKTGYKIYTDKCSYLVGVDVKGTGKYSGYKVRLFYVKGNLPTDTRVKKGDPIGVQQSLQKNCYPKMTNGKYCMTNHVHVELIVNGFKKDPTTYNWGKSSLGVNTSDEVKKLSKYDEDDCPNNDCWSYFGKEKFWNGNNKVNNITVPKITITKSSSLFKITYKGVRSGLLLKHGFGGKGDTIHQLLNVLTLELNTYLKENYLKPVVSSIKMNLVGDSLSIEVPLIYTINKKYVIDRRGSLGGKIDDIGLKKYETMDGYEVASHTSDNLKEKFITVLSTQNKGVEKTEPDKKNLPKPVLGKKVASASSGKKTSLPTANRWGRPHHGYDVVGPYGYKKNVIVCNKPGIVDYASVCGSYGNFVSINHDGGIYSAYGHLDKIYVRDGQEIKVGDPIGLMGNTGHSTGPHLHFEERVTRPKKLKNRCGGGSPYNEVYGYGKVRPSTEMDNYYYWQESL